MEQQARQTPSATQESTEVHAARRPVAISPEMLKLVVGGSPKGGWITTEALTVLDAPTGGWL
jgi:hypothetical protein